MAVHSNPLYKLHLSKTHKRQQQQRKSNTGVYNIMLLLSSISANISFYFWQCLMKANDKKKKVYQELDSAKKTRDTDS